MLLSLERQLRPYSATGVTTVKLRIDPGWTRAGLDGQLDGLREYVRVLTHGFIFWI